MKRKSSPQERPKILFKYRADNDFTERIFNTGLVWLSTATQLNDPFECSFRSAPPEWTARTIYSMKQAQFQGLFEHLSDAVSAGIPYFQLPRKQVVAFYDQLRGLEFEEAYQQLIVFSENASGRRFSRPDQLLDDLEDRRNSLGIFSMAESKDNVLMWAHYGGEQRGLCIGFKVSEGTALSDPDRCFPVRYANGFPGFGGGGLITELQFLAGGKSAVGVSPADPIFRAAMSTKSPDWAYEREWRYVERRGGSYEWPAPIAEVIFGLRCPQDRRAHYVDIIEEFVPGDVEIYDVEKIKDTSALRCRHSHIVRGRGKAEPLRNHGHVVRLGTEATFRAHIDSLIRDRRYNAALADLDRNLLENPNEANLLEQKATVLGISGKHQEALLIYEMLCERFPDVALGWYQRGVALSSLNRLREAADSYQRALALDSNDASTNFNLGSVLTRLGAQAEAEKHIRVAAEKGHPKAANYIAILDSTRGTVE